jgi:hypothetical protein
LQELAGTAQTFAKLDQGKHGESLQALQPWRMVLSAGKVVSWDAADAKFRIAT